MSKKIPREEKLDEVPMIPATSLPPILLKIPTCKTFVLAVVDDEGMLHINNKGQHHEVIGLSEVLHQTFKNKFMQIMDGAVLTQKQGAAANG